MRVEQVLVRATAGRLRYSEDARYTVQTEGIFFADVVDGHGDPMHSTAIVRFAEFIAVELAEQFMTVKDVDVFPELFDVVNAKAEDKFGEVSLCGAVAMCVAIKEAKPELVVAWAGDCRLYRYVPENMYRNFQLTADHNAHNPAEAARIRPLCSPDGVNVVVYGYDADHLQLMRLAKEERHGRIMMIIPTRGFGDCDFHPVFTHVPEVRKIAFDPTHFNLFALCSDGGADVVREVFRNLGSNARELSSLDIMQVIQKTADMCVPKNPKDDITIVFFLVHPF